MVVARDFHPEAVERPRAPAVGRVMIGDHVVVVGQPHANAPRGKGRSHPRQVFGEFEGLHLLAIETDADEGFGIVEQ